MDGKVKWSEVTQSYLTLCNPMDCTPPGSSIHGIFQARILEWIAISFSRRSSQPRDWIQVSHIVGRHFTIWATREVMDGKRALKKILNHVSNYGNANLNSNQIPPIRKGAPTRMQNNATLIHCWWGCKLYNYFGRQPGSFHKTKYAIAIWLRYPNHR